MNFKFRFQLGLIVYNSGAQRIDLDVWQYLQGLHSPPDADLVSDRIDKAGRRVMRFRVIEQEELMFKMRTDDLSQWRSP